MTRVLFGETHRKTFWRNKHWRFVFLIYSYALEIFINFNVLMLPKLSDVGKEAEIPRETCTYVVERCTEKISVLQ